jgi:hypothetical protein
MKMDTNYPKREVLESNEQTVPNSKNEEVVGYRIPTEIIELPSKGLLYPKGSPLHSGNIEIKYMTAKEEDILTTESYIKKGVVLDRFLESLIVTEGVKLDDLILGDVDALTVAARIFGYGNEYDVSIDTPSGKKQRESVDLSELSLNYLEERFLKEVGLNEFEFELPSSKVVVTFRIMTQGDQKRFQMEIDKNKKLFTGQAKLSSTQLKHQIVSVDGNKDQKFIRDFVDNGILASDARALRKFIEGIQPGVNLSVEVTDRETGEPFQVDTPIGIQFFWPDAKV